MLLIILGAGASYDSVARTPAPPAGHATGYPRPPLANELFDAREVFLGELKNWPRLNLIAPNLQRRRDGYSLEGQLYEFLQEAEDHPDLYGSLMSVRYYIQAILRASERDWRTHSSGSINHVPLLSEAIRWSRRSGEKVIIVTFNYDCLVEYALELIGKPIVQSAGLEGYVDRDDFQLYKLHGSSDWGRILRTERAYDKSVPQKKAADETIAYAAGMQLSDTYFPLSENLYPTGHTYASPGVPAIPAIAVPIEKKSEFECPPNHVERLVSLLPQVKRVLIVGWRGTEEHFTRLLATHLRAPDILLVCGGTDYSEATARQLQKMGVMGRFTTNSWGFSDLIVNRDFGKWLGL